VSRATVRRRFRAYKREAFDTEREYRRFLRSAKQTENDVLVRVGLDLLQARLTRHVTREAGNAAEEERALDRFSEGFRRKWAARTACARGYATADCSRKVASIAGGSSRAGHGSSTVSASRR